MRSPNIEVYKDCVGRVIGWVWLAQGARIDVLLEGRKSDEPESGAGAASELFLVIVSAASGFWVHRALSNPLRSSYSVSILVICADQPQNGSLRADALIYIHVKLCP